AFDARPVTGSSGGGCRALQPPLVFALQVYPTRRMAHAVKENSGDSLGEFGRGGAVADRARRTCPVCGAKFLATIDIDRCPVCALRDAVGAESESSDAITSASESGSDETKPLTVATRF